MKTDIQYLEECIINKCFNNIPNIKIKITQKSDLSATMFELKRKSIFKKFRNLDLFELSMFITRVLDKLNIKWCYGITDWFTTRQDMNKIVITEPIDLDHLSFMFKSYIKSNNRGAQEVPRDECTYRFQTPPCPRMRDGVRRNKYLDAHASRLR